MGGGYGGSDRGPADRTWRRASRQMSETTCVRTDAHELRPDDGGTDSVPVVWGVPASNTSETDPTTFAHRQELFKVEFVISRLRDFATESRTGM